MADRDALRVVQGGRDLVEVLEDQLAKARAGELRIVIVATAGVDNVHRYSWAYVEGEAHAWSQMAAMVAGIQHDLMQGGL